MIPVGFTLYSTELMLEATVTVRECNFPRVWLKIIFSGFSENLRLKPARAVTLRLKLYWVRHAYITVAVSPSGAKLAVGVNNKLMVGVEDEFGEERFMTESRLRRS